MTDALPPGWASDLAVLRLTGAEVTEHSDHLVVRSPANPDHHWGNFVLVTDPGALDDAQRWRAVFEEALPGARHGAVGLVARADPAPWAAIGWAVESEDVLASAQPPEQRPLPGGYDVRPLATEDDWTAHVELAVRENARTGEHAAERHRMFVEGRTRSRRRVVEAGRASWFGAFARDGELAGDLGIMLCGDGLARYQDVGTDAEHRRRGLAGHLLGVAGSWAADRGSRRWVILTEADNPAGRLYRSVGFAPTTPEHQAYRSPTPGPDTGAATS